MAGIEKITEEILKKAEEEKSNLLTEAENDARKIHMEAEDETNELTEKIRTKAEEKVKDIQNRMTSSEALKKKQILLKTRQEIISNLLEEAKKSIAGAEPEAYFGIMLKLLKANVQKNEGEIRFSKEDLSRLPKGFEEKVQAIAEEAGGKLKLSSVPADIRNGFVLVYGMIEENCSLDAVFNGSKDELTDLIHSML